MNTTSIYILFIVQIVSDVLFAACPSTITGNQSCPFCDTCKDLKCRQDGELCMGGCPKEWKGVICEGRKIFTWKMSPSDCVIVEHCTICLRVLCYITYGRCWPMSNSV